MLGYLFQLGYPSCTDHRYLFLWQPVQEPYSQVLEERTRPHLHHQSSNHLVVSSQQETLHHQGQVRHLILARWSVQR